MIGSVLIYFNFNSFLSIYLNLSLSGIKLEIWTALTKARSDNYAGPDLEQE